jgi:hypothetical protein
MYMYIIYIIYIYTNLDIRSRDELWEHAPRVLKQLGAQRALVELEPLGDAGQVPDGLDRALDAVHHTVGHQDLKIETKEHTVTRKESPTLVELEPLGDETDPWST